MVRSLMSPACAMVTPPPWTVTAPPCLGMAPLWTVMEPPPMTPLCQHTMLLCPLTTLPFHLMAPRCPSVSVGEKIDSFSAVARVVRNPTRVVTAVQVTMLQSQGTVLQAQVTELPVLREHSTLEEAMEATRTRTRSM